MTRVFLLRHGATASNLEVPYRLQGRGSDRPLGDAGRIQAEAAGRALSETRLVAVYASPLLRSIETAQAVATLHGLDVRIEAGIIEADIGRWENLTWAEAEERDPEHHRRFMDDPGTTPYPDGESFQDAGRRAAGAIAEIAARHPGDAVAIVGHNILNRAYLAPLIGVPIAKARAIRQANGGINLIEFEGANATLITLNSVLHLDGLGPTA